MSTFYLKGLSTDKDQIEIIQRDFLSQGIELVPLFLDYANVYNWTEQEILDYIAIKIEIYNDNEPINIICHSMGCNLGMLIHLKTLIPVNKFFFVSPEFVQTTSKEKKQIAANYNGEKTPKESERVGFKNYLTYLKSVKYFTRAFRNDMIPFNDLTVVYSKGDTSVSQDAIKNSCIFRGADVIVSNTDSNNPLLVDSDCVHEIVKRINDPYCKLIRTKNKTSK